MQAVAEIDLHCRCDRWTCTPALAVDRFARLRSRLALDHCKWDPQVGDVSTLAPFALVLPNDTWRQLAELAERLAAEALWAEEELLHRPDLLCRLGLPRRVRLALSASAPLTPPAGRVFRFDFHPTPAGWRISEANSDVPGGYTEAAAFAELMAAEFPGMALIGDPADRLADAILKSIGGPGSVALLAATGYMEDQQVTAYLAGRLRQRGCITHRAHPRQIRWVGGISHLHTAWHRGSLDAVVRFYQGEWLGDLPAECGWPCFFRGGRTPVCSPGSALIVESKRFPLVWDELSADLCTWKALLPETRDPRRADWRRDPGWLLKAAFCNTGDAVTIRGLAKPRQWRRAAWGAWLRPGWWVAQRRFDAMPLPTPAGEMYPCLGVYVVDGLAAGVYGRLAPRPLIDFAARDVAVLVQQSSQLAPRVGGLNSRSELTTLPGLRAADGQASSV